ncbi:TetR/AcrR family transcriptional regulator C-terminal domain-containing protein [Hoeflea sp.]|uniref:TetR/AcrR family transcriptional regulator C-terminal domain-containing protein n=1 Tax=Hoeflea sp. TaxID=1940281 RepID=UPI0019886310|nr:TetR/AcrR family transcriptional regulator C-terminal domain-containing protein [Hoeflea sp.]MBC7281156.1 TetR/AcrR family transcriptional regulator C-terminal domain-containing protein [Hoeflea sp.]
MTIAVHPILPTERQTAAIRDAADRAAPGAEVEFSERQREVLDAVLRLMVAEGDGFSVAAVARAASCSKETLYKWFGDRDGLLTATVRWQASKVRMPKLPRDRLTHASLSAALTGFAESWLTVITGDLSIALNRAAVSHAGSGKSRLGEIVLTNGPFAMKSRIEPLLEAGRAAGLLDFEDPADAFRSFFGLVVADTQIRALLGDGSHPDEAGIRALSAQAVTKFLGLYGRR